MKVTVRYASVPGIFEVMRNVCSSEEGSGEPIASIGTIFQKKSFFLAQSKKEKPQKCQKRPKVAVCYFTLIIAGFESNH